MTSKLEGRDMSAEGMVSVLREARRLDRYNILECVYELNKPGDFLIIEYTDLRYTRRYRFTRLNVKGEIISEDTKTCVFIR